MNWAEILLPMALFALATSATPGPVNVISAMTGATFGPTRSLPYVMGATASFVAILLLLGIGLRVILEWIEQFSLVLTLAGSVYMLWLAWRIAAARGDLNLDGERAHCPGFKAGAITQGVNPKAWIVSLSAISVYVGPHADYLSRLAAFAALFFVICAASLFAWAIVGFRIARVTGNISVFNKAMAGLLAISVLMMLIEEFQFVWS